LKPSNEAFQNKTRLSLLFLYVHRVMSVVKGITKLELTLGWLRFIHSVEAQRRISTPPLIYCFYEAIILHSPAFSFR
jgi:hypothetical protein